MADPPETYPEDVREAFEYCHECETICVSADQHVCSISTNGDGNDGHKSAAERARLAQLDDRPLEEQVLYPKGRSQNNAWAYHELDAGENPRHELDHSAGANIGPREEAINQGCYPCGQCRLLEERGGGDE